MKRVLIVFFFWVASLSLIAADPVKIIPNMDVAAIVNREELLTVVDRLNLPAGRVIVDKAPVFSRTNSGMFLAGNGTTIVNSHPKKNWVTGRAIAIRPGGQEGTAVLSFYETPAQRPYVMPAKQVGWLFNSNGSDGLGFYPGPVQRFGPREDVPDDSKLPNFMRAFHAAPFVGTKTLKVSKDHGFKVGDDVFATDGPLINEVVPEYRKIAELAAPDSIVLNEPLTRTYKQGTLVGGPIPCKMTFQGIQFSGTAGPVVIQQSCDIKFSDCVFDAAPGVWASAIGCGRLTFLNCTMPSGFQSSTSHDIQFRNCTIREVQGEQVAYDFKFDGCRFGPAPFDTKTLCTGWHLKECVSSGPLMIYDGWTVTDHVAYGPVIIRGRDAVVRNFWSAQAVQVQALYQGCPPKAGTNLTLDNIVAPSIHLMPGTSGTILNRTCPVTGDTTNWKITPKQ